MLRGPIEYVPPATVEVLLRRDAIPLDENEGIYVRDIKLERQDLKIIKNRSTKCFLKLSISMIFRITFECLNSFKNSHMGKLEDILRLGLRA